MRKSGSADQPEERSFNGKWEAEFLGGGSIHLGGTRNLSPVPHAIEFSWATLPALARGPGKLHMPAVMLFFAPAEPIGHDYPGSFMQGPVGAMLDFVVTREQFSDVLRWIETGRLKRVDFSVEVGEDGKWPISSWSTIVEISKG